MNPLRCAILIVLIVKATAFCEISVSRKQRTTTLLHASSRRTAILAGAAAFWTTASPALAIMDDDAIALRLVRSSIKKLKATQDIVDQSDYQSLQSVFRSPPVSNIRKACTTLARGNDELKELYGTFIADLERLDTTAMTALRGRTIPEQELADRYQATLTALEAFEASATKAAAGTSSLQDQVQAL